MADIPKYNGAVIVKDSVEDDIGICIEVTNACTLSIIVENVMEQFAKTEVYQDYSDLCRMIIQEYAKQYPDETWCIYAHRQGTRYAFPSTLIFVYATENTFQCVQ